MLVWAVVKFAHELGHGLACHRFGGECRDLGCFFIAGLPVLYCDVSDAWAFPGRWRRAVVSLAGVYVELVIAVACGGLWLAAEPGVARSLLGQVVFVCAVSTLLFNLNPLLRLDAYYLLSDLTDRPNLYTESRRAVVEPIARWLTRGRVGSHRTTTPPWLPAYAVASATYRFFVMCVICWIVWHGLQAAHLEAVAAAFCMICAAGVVAPAVMKLWSIARRPRAFQLVSRLRLALLIAGVGGAATLVAFAPAPNTLIVPAMVEHRDPQLVVAPNAGRLVALVSYGDRVAAGEKLARIESPELQLQLAEAEAKLSELRLERATLESQLAYAEGNAARIETLKAAEEGVAEQLSAVRADVESLTLTAARGGVVSEPPLRLTPPSETALVGWQGLPLSSENGRCRVEAGDVLCVVADPQDVEALLLVDQSDLGLVGDTAGVRMRFANGPAETFYGATTAIGQRPVTHPPAALAASPLVTTRTDSTGAPVLVGKHYFVKASIDARAPNLSPRSPGFARVECPRRTLGQLLWRELSEVFFVAR